MPANAVRGRLSRDRADRGLIGDRVAESPLFHLVAEALEKLLVDRAMHVKPLDRAARLAGIGEASIRDLGYRRCEIRVRPHIGGILAAELQMDVSEGARRRPVHLEAPA